MNSQSQSIKLEAVETASRNAETRVLSYDASHEESFLPFQIMRRFDPLQLMELILEASASAVYVIDSNYRLLQTSPDTVFPPRHDPLVPCYTALAGRDAPCPDCSAPAALSTRLASVSEGISPPFPERPCLIKRLPFRAASGEWLLATIVHDITERRSVEWKLTEQLDFMETLMESIPIPVFCKNPEGHYTCFNKAFKDLFGLTRDNVVHETVGDISPTGVADLLNRNEVTLLHRLGRQIHPADFIDRSGHRHQLMLHTAPMKDSRNGATGLIGVILDITERAAIESDLRVSKELFQNLAQLSPVGIIRTDGAGICHYVNTQWTVISGQSSAQSMGIYWPNLLHPEDRTLVEPVWRAQAASEGAFKHEFRFEHPDGNSVWALGQMMIERNDKGEISGYIGTVTDITERKLAEEALQTSIRQQRAILDNVPDMAWLKDQDFTLIAVNEPYARISHSRLADLIGKTDFDIWPEHIARTMRADDEAVVRSGQPLSREEQLTFGMQPPRWYETIRTPIYDERHRMIGTAGIARDITDRKQAEEERARMEVQLRHSQKMQSIGGLAAGIAHEVNTPIQFIGDNGRFLSDAFAELMTLIVQVQAFLDDGGTDSTRLRHTLDMMDLTFLKAEIPNAIDQLLEGTERVAKIVRAMKEFSHPGTEKKHAIDINRVVENTVTIARSEWKYVAEVQLDLDPMLPLVTCVPGDFNQVVLNLLVNAAHAIAERIGGNRDASADKSGLIGISTRRDGEHVMISVSDNGMGILPEHRSRIFEPFFTTKEVGKGTGQGLTILYNVVVTKHGGSITFDTEPGKGTIFHVRVPISPPEK